MTIRRSSQGGTPFGTTANRPANPAVGQTYYNGTLGYLEIYTASGWAAAAKGIAFGNTANRPASPDLGTPYFNGQEARLELYTSNGWQNIVQETPAVVSIVGQLNETTTSTITINGTNFAPGATAFAVDTNGLETVANTTTIVSVVEVTAVFPALPTAGAPYDVKIVNPSNLYGVLYETLGVNDKPVWSTTSGSIGTFTELDVVSITVAATDAVDSTNSALQYTVVSGALPGGLSLNASTGVISGTVSNILSNTTYSFTLGASDSRNTTQTRAFSISINDRSPVWATASALPAFSKNIAYSTSVSATDDDSGAIVYSLVSGTLPTGLTLSSSGLISGTATSSINAEFTIRATFTVSGNTVDRAFTMANAVPVWSTTSPISYTLNTPWDGGSLSVIEDGTVTYSIVSGTLPAGLSMSSSGIFTGTPTTSNITVTIRATDDNGGTADRAFRFNRKPVWSTSAGSLPGATKDVAYSTTITATDDVSLSYSLSSGSLPTGLSLNTSTGVISGTPTVYAPSPASFTITATDSDGTTLSRAFSIAVFQISYTSFTASTSWTPALSQTIDYMILGGGGGGGTSSNDWPGRGGGGAGGLKAGTVAVTGGTSYSIVVGGAGAGGGAGTSTSNDGGGSSAFGISVSGGGGGGSPVLNNYTGRNGGSGGGGTYTFPGGSGVSGEGNNGGSGSGANTSGNGGGGGGKGSAGSSAGSGGSGYSWINGTTYAGGGAGGGGDSAPGQNFSGGSGGGGNTQTSATGYGSGGGASRQAGTSSGSGSPGIVIIRALG